MRRAAGGRHPEQIPGSVFQAESAAAGSGEMHAVGVEGGAAESRDEAERKGARPDGVGP